MAAVTLSHVGKSYGAVGVLHGVSVDIADGEFVILVGQSGCGKSTLLRMIAGLESVTSGDISIGDRVINDLPPKDRDIAMVFQNYALYPHMTVRKNMEFGLKLRGTPRAEINEKVAHASAILGLESLMERLPRELSGGQRQRVAMGRAIVRDPQVFLFDEPLSNLDAKLRVHMRTEIKALHQRLGATVIYVTHDQIEAMTMADKIVVMHDGRIAQQGAPLDIYDRPANLFVAQFIGSPSMNILDGQFAGDGSAVFITDKGVHILLANVPAENAGRPAKIGIRPEHIMLNDSGIAARVIVTEPTGSETQLTLDVDGHELVVLIRDRVDYKPNDVLKIGLAQNHIHAFDADSGSRLTL